MPGDRKVSGQADSGQLRCNGRDLRGQLGYPPRPIGVSDSAHVGNAVAREPGTGGAAGFGNASVAAGTWAPLWPTVFRKGQIPVLDSAGQLFTALGANIRLAVDGTDNVGRWAIAN